MEGFVETLLDLFVRLFIWALFGILGIVFVPAVVIGILYFEKWHALFKTDKFKFWLAAPIMVPAWFLTYISTWWLGLVEIS